MAWKDERMESTALSREYSGNTKISWEWLSKRGYTGSYPSWWDGTSSCRQEILWLQGCIWGLLSISSCLDCRSIYLNAVAKHCCLGGHPHLSSGYLVVHPRNPKWMIALETMVDVGHRNTSPTGTSIEWCNSVTNISGKGLPSGYGWIFSDLGHRFQSISSIDYPTSKYSIWLVVWLPFFTFPCLGFLSSSQLTVISEGWRATSNQQCWPRPKWTCITSKVKGFGILFDVSPGVESSGRDLCNRKNPRGRKTFFVFFPNRSSINGSKRGIFHSCENIWVYLEYLFFFLGVFFHSFETENT